MARIDPKIEESWKAILATEFGADYFQTLKDFLKTEKASYTIYPPGNEIFAAFENTSFDDVKVVILGQDPYHGDGQAHGLCFSVRQGIKPPPSLLNIFKELHSDVNLAIPSHGDLSSWARQGVLLLNATLTVRAHQAGSHQNKGWENFTNAVIKKLSDEKSGLIFLLWGRFAQSKESLIDLDRHYVLKAAHPSPFSAHSGFFGCKHFSKVNEMLAKMGLLKIDWSVG